MGGVLHVLRRLPVTCWRQRSLSRARHSLALLYVRFTVVIQLFVKVSPVDTASPAALLWSKKNFIGYDPRKIMLNSHLGLLNSSEADSPIHYCPITPLRAAEREFSGRFADRVGSRRLTVIVQWPLFTVRRILTTDSLRLDWRLSGVGGWVYCVPAINGWLPKTQRYERVNPVRLEQGVLACI